MNRCTETHDGMTCEREDGHDGLHRAGVRTWRFDDPFRPAWLRRLQAKDYTGSVAL